MSNEILKEFLEQSGIDPKSITQSRIYEKTMLKAERIADKDTQMRLWMERTGGTIEAPELKNHIDVPSQIAEEMINQIPKSHPHFSGYDHSLEQDRWKEIGGMCDPIEMEDIL